MPELLTIRKETSRTTKLFLAALAWVLVVVIWSLVTHWELISSYVFPTPLEVLQAFPALFSERGLLGNVYASWFRIAHAFLWCVVIAVPLGLLMASFRWLNDLVNPVAAPMRSMPITAFLPAFIGIFAIGVAAFLFRFLLTLLEKVLFPWRQTTQSASDSSGTGSIGRLHKKAVSHGS